MAAPPHFFVLSGLIFAPAEKVTHLEYNVIFGHDKIICFMGPHKMKTTQYFAVLDTIWNLDSFSDIFVFP